MRHLVRRPFSQKALYQKTILSKDRIFYSFMTHSLLVRKPFSQKAHHSEDPFIRNVLYSFFIKITNSITIMSVKTLTIVIHANENGTLCEYYDWLMSENAGYKCTTKTVESLSHYNCIWYRLLTELDAKYYSRKLHTLI